MMSQHLSPSWSPPPPAISPAPTTSSTEDCSPPSDVGSPGRLAGAGVHAVRVARRTAGAAHLPDVSRQAAGLAQRAAEQELDLGVGAAQVVAGPPGQRVVHSRVESEQDALAFGHYWYREPVFTT